MTTNDIAVVMFWIVPIILAIVIVGFIVFVKWSRKDRQVDDWRDIK